MSFPLPAACGLSRRALLATLLAAALPARLPVAATIAAGTGDVMGQLSYYVVHGDETLLDIARAHNLGVPEISAVNSGVDPWLPGDGTLLTLPTAFILPDAPREGIVVNYGELRLYFFPRQGPVQTYAIGVGRDGFELKLGQTRIVRKQVQPTWYPTESVQRDKPWIGKLVPPGPDNPLGEFALYLGWPTYLVHGTNKPYGVGRRVSRGCIRMYPEGVEQLFAQVPVGTRVTAVDQRVKLGWQEGELYLEAHPDFAEIDALEARQAISPQPPDPADRELVLGKAGEDADRLDWPLIDRELAGRRGIPIRITRPRGSPSNATLAAESPDGRAPPAPPLAAPVGVGSFY